MEYRSIVDPSEPNYRSKLADDIKDTMREYNSRPPTARSNGKAAQPEKGAIRTASDLRKMIFPAISYVVPGFIAEGCTVLAGAPKIGKSWLVMDVSLAVARGGFCLGEAKCPQGDVLYLALEDNERRLQRRIGKVLGSEFNEWPEAFHYATDWPRANEGGIQRIRDWIAAAKNPRLVVVDVLAMFRAPRSDKQSVYEGDYAAIKELQQIASDTGVAIVIVHHVRKGGSDLDPFEEVSGTFGIMGAADAGLILRRTSNGVTMFARGRDIEEAETAVTFDKENCRWRALGEADDVHRSDERGKVLAALAEASEPLDPKSIAFAAGSNRNAIDRLLFAMVRDGEVAKAGRGLYVHPDKANLTDEDASRGKIGKKVRNEKADAIPPRNPLENEPIEAGDASEAATSRSVNLTDLTDLTEADDEAVRKQVAGDSHRVRRPPDSGAGQRQAAAAREGSGCDGARYSASHCAGMRLKSNKDQLLAG